MKRKYDKTAEQLTVDGWCQFYIVFTSFISGYTHSKVDCVKVSTINSVSNWLLICIRDHLTMFDSFKILLWSFSIKIASADGLRWKKRNARLCVMVLFHHIFAPTIQHMWGWSAGALPSHDPIWTDLIELTISGILTLIWSERCDGVEWSWSPPLSLFLCCCLNSALSCERVLNCCLNSGVSCEGILNSCLDTRG